MRFAPSILASDLADLNAGLAQCVAGGADLVHVDVMDGHFVPNLTFGPPVVAAMARSNRLPLDIHLMVTRPEVLLGRYLELRPHWLSVHWEAAGHLDRTLGVIRDAGVGAGVALNPATSIEVLAEVLPLLDFVLLMSVNPGFAGQPFIPYVLAKARRLRDRIDELGVGTQIAMDGGIGAANIDDVATAGVDVAVMGSAIFGAADPVGALRALRARCGVGS